ncbi:glutathione S-transferase family protein [Hyphococcus formosus]|uniref:glutathione S-transferase family protein n=1 Tax=Hyphococcus formosus TaxID=3143534 RepID=UPI00398BBA3F
MADEVTIIGTPVSPYVRKVLALLELKKVSYKIDPVVAFYTDEDFLKINPLRRIPVLLHDGNTIIDSSVIAAYIEETFPTPSTLPSSPGDRATARWLEEFSDTRMADIFLWRCFGSVVLKPGLWNEERDLKTYRETLAGPVVEIMDYLETIAPEDGFLFGDIGLGDISIAIIFWNMRVARWQPDPKQWPKAAAWIARTEAHPALARSTDWAMAMLRTPVPAQREKAIEIGVPVTDETYLRAVEPTRGPMSQF